jgi:hypothetical protein
MKKYSFLISRRGQKSLKWNGPFIIMHDFPIFFLTVEMVLIVEWGTLYLFNFSSQVEKHVNALIVNESCNRACARVRQVIDSLFQK